MDDEWHPFESTPHAWYRVWRKRLVQRVNFADALEEVQLLPLMRTVEPLEFMGRTGGFREEMEVLIQSEGFAVVGPLGYAPEDLPDLERLLRPNKMSVSVKGNLANVIIPFETLDHDSLAEVRERLALARQLYDESK